MENVLEQLREKADKHLNKIRTHTEVKKSLELEYNSLDLEDPKRERVGEQLLTTLLSIEYHKGSAKTYGKSVALIEEELKRK